MESAASMAVPLAVCVYPESGTVVGSVSIWLSPMPIAASAAYRKSFSLSRDLTVCVAVDDKRIAEPASAASAKVSSSTRIIAEPARPLAPVVRWSRIRVMRGSGLVGSDIGGRDRRRQRRRTITRYDFIVVRRTRDETATGMGIGVGIVRGQGYLRGDALQLHIRLIRMQLPVDQIHTHRLLAARVLVIHRRRPGQAHGVLAPRAAHGRKTPHGGRGTVALGDPRHVGVGHANLLIHGPIHILAVMRIREPTGERDAHFANRIERRLGRRGLPVENARRTESAVRKLVQSVQR